MSATTAADQIAAQVGTLHHGLTVMELGEDGGTLVVLGHHADRRTLAALNHYARKVWSADSIAGDLPDPGDGAHVLNELQRVRGLVVHACDLGWGADEPIPAADLQMVDPDDNSCPDCARIGANWALLYRDDVQDHPSAFPVTVWEYDQ